jgi:DNA-binding GntR family transcriptional regulator
MIASTLTHLPANRPTLQHAPQTDKTQLIVDSIVNAIVERQLLPGTKLVEQKIANQFGVSRTIVRQAFNQLSRDRLIRLLPARGAHVSCPSPTEARQIFEVRSLLEGTMISSLAQTISASQIKELKRHLKAEEMAVNKKSVSGRTKLLADFHVLLARLAGNEVLAQLLSDLLARCSLIALTVQSNHSAQESHREHVELVEALEKRDVSACEVLLKTHLASVAASLKKIEPTHTESHTRNIC